MSNELVRYGQKALVSSDGSLKKDAGSALVKIGGGGLALGALAYFIPFVNLPMLLVAAVVLGVFFYVK